MEDDTTTTIGMEAVRVALCAFLRSSHDAVESAFGDAEDPAAFASQLLVEEEPRPTATAITSTTVLSSFPAHAPLIDQFACIIATWFTTQRCPLLDQPAAIDGVSILTTSRDQVLSVPFPIIHRFVQSCLHASPLTETTEPTASLITALGGARGVLTCLGFRETVGSRTIAPLTSAQCLASFLQLQSSREKLTVGARAFTKHCARSSDGFWGSMNGNDLVKNATALAKVQHILATCVWKNVHSLPHGEATLEIRTASGYGARWHIRDQSFRGFLEPQMANGHENRWRH